MPSRRFDFGAVRAISWDIDGTLYSKRRVTARLWFAMLAASSRGRAREAWEALAELRRFGKQMERVRTRGGRVPPDDARTNRRVELERRWLSPAIAATGPRPGVADTLRFFGKHLEFQVALSDFECGHKLASLGLADAFSATYAGERLGHLKPSPEPFRRVLQDFGLPPQCLLHIGDRPDTDSTGANAAGCSALLLGRDFRSFSQLRSMFATGQRSGRASPIGRGGNGS